MPVDPGLTVSDSAATTLASATVAISSGYTAGDVLSATTTGTPIAAAYAAGTLTLSGVAPLATYQSVLQSVSFTGTTQVGGSRTVIWTASDGTTTASAVTTISYIAPPGAPVSVTATPGDGQATVSFFAPLSDGGSQIVSYTVTASPGGATVTGSAGPLTLTGLTNGTMYTVAVTATNAAGTSAPSAPAAVTPGTTPGAAAAAQTPAAPAGGGAPGGAGGPALAVGPGVSTPKSHVVTTLAVTQLWPVLLRGKHTRLVLIVHPSRATQLVLVLRGPGGRILVTWRRRLLRGAHRLFCDLPVRARHVARDTLRLSWTGGGKAKVVKVTVRQ